MLRRMHSRLINVRRTRCSALLLLLSTRQARSSTSAHREWWSCPRYPSPEL